MQCFSRGSLVFCKGVVYEKKYFDVRAKVSSILTLSLALVSIKPQPRLLAHRSTNSSSTRDLLKRAILHGKPNTILNTSYISAATLNPVPTLQCSCRTFHGRQDRNYYLWRWRIWYVRMSISTNIDASNLRLTWNFAREQASPP